MRVFLSFLLVCISIPILAQKQPIGCPLDQAILNAPAIGVSKVSAEDLKSFILDQLKLMPPYVNRSFKPSSFRFFSVKKEPGDLNIYDLNFHPSDAYLALRGQGASRVLPLYLLLHAIVHTDLKHSEASKTQEMAVDEKVGAYLAQLGVLRTDIEIMLSRHIKDGATRKADILRGYPPPNIPPDSAIKPIITPPQEKTPPPVQRPRNPTPIPTVKAEFEIIKPSDCKLPCTVTIGKISEGAQTYTWYIDGKQQYVRYSAKEFNHPFEEAKTYKIELIAKYSSNDYSSKIIEFTIPKPPQNKGIVGLWEINAFAALPLGNYGSSLIYDANSNRWNPNAGMALLGGGIEATLGIKALNWLSLGMHLGAMYSPYNTNALNDRLGAYQDNRRELLDKRNFTSTGHRFTTVAGYLSLDPTQGGRFYLAFEPAYGLLLLPFQNEVSVAYQKEDGKVNTTRIFYGDQGNSTAYFAGKLSLGIRTGSLQRKNQKEESLIYVSGSYMHADLKIATQSHSFGDNSTPLTISQLPIRGANLGIGYRHTF
jgi:hypothetical protein